MKFSDTPLPGAYLIDLEKREDARGFFARSFCHKEYGKQELEQHYVQMNHSLSKEKGTLRGLHYQLSPMQEVKVVRCIRGSIWDCILDLRPASPSFGKWFGAVLSASNGSMLYVPKGCAHGFISLEDNSEVLYQVSEYYSPELERGVRWNDPQFGIQWPIAPKILSERDSLQPDFQHEDLIYRE